MGLVWLLIVPLLLVESSDPDEEPPPPRNPAPTIKWVAKDSYAGLSCDDACGAEPDLSGGVENMTCIETAFVPLREEIGNSTLNQSGGAPDYSDNYAKQNSWIYAVFRKAGIICHEIEDDCTSMSGCSAEGAPYILKGEELEDPDGYVPPDDHEYDRAGLDRLVTCQIGMPLADCAAVPSMNETVRLCPCAIPSGPYGHPRARLVKHHLAPSGLKSAKDIRRSGEPQLTASNHSA